MRSSDIAIATVFLAVITGVVLIIMAILNHRVKIRMINAGYVDENAVKLLSSSENLKFDALKWGIILLFGGIGLILLEYIPYPEQSPLPFGIETVCLAIGFLAYYFITRAESKRSNNPYAK